MALGVDDATVAAVTGFAPPARLDVRGENVAAFGLALDVAMVLRVRHVVLSVQRASAGLYSPPGGSSVPSSKSQDRTAEQFHELARLRYGAARADELRSLQTNLVAGLQQVAAADLTDADEPDFLDSEGAS